MRVMVTTISRDSRLTISINRNITNRTQNQTCLLLIVRVTWVPMRPFKRGGRALTSEGQKNALKLIISTIETSVRTKNEKSINALLK